MKKLSLEQEAQQLADASGEVWTKRKVLRLWEQLSHKERGQLGARLRAFNDAKAKAEREHHARLIQAVKENLSLGPGWNVKAAKARGSGRKTKPGRVRAHPVVPVQKLPAGTNPNT